MRKFALFVFFVAPLWAVDVTTSIRTVSNEGTDQLLGSFTLNLNDNTFPNASPTNPAYVRFRLSAANSWARTLVDLREDAVKGTDRPINIAVYPSTGVLLNPNMPADAVQLVRLIAGEQSGWLKITWSTSNWVASGSGSTHPSQENVVSMTVGVSGENSIRPGANTHSGGNENPNNGLTTSTRMRADYRNTPNFRANDLERLDFIAFDATTSGVETGRPRQGADLGVGFSNDNVIARGGAFIPCYEYHFAPDDFDGDGHVIGINRFDLVRKNTYCKEIPPVYLTNSSDFPWEPGSRFFLTLQHVNPTWLVEGGYPPYFDPTCYDTRLVETDPVVTPTHESTWKISRVFIEEEFVGYEFLLEEGDMPIWAQIEVSELLACAPTCNNLENCYDGDRLILNAYAWYVSRTMTLGELESLGAQIRLTASYHHQAPDYDHHIMPFTAHDQEHLEFSMNVVNRSNKDGLMTVLCYSRHGFLLETLSSLALPASGSLALDLPALFGEDRAGSITWVELMADVPVSVLGVVGDRQQTMLDIFPASNGFQHTLYGAHVPLDTASWKATAYLISADVEVPPEFNTNFTLTLTGQDTTPITTMRRPGYSIAIPGDDLLGGSASPWFRIDAVEESAVGQLFFSRTDNTQMASISLNTSPQEDWRFDHLGDRTGGWWNGLVLLNSSDETVRLDVKVYSGEDVLAGSQELELDALTKHISLIDDLFPGITPARLEIEAREPVIAALLMGRLDEPLMTTVPGSIPKERAFILPYLPDDGGWLGIALTNTMSLDATLTLTPYKANGVPGTPVTRTIAGNSKDLLLLNDLIVLDGTYSHIRLDSSTSIRAFGLTGNTAGARLAAVPITVPVEDP